VVKRRGLVPTPDTPDEVAGKQPTKRANLYDYRWRSEWRGLCELPAAA